MGKVSSDKRSTQVKLGTCDYSDRPHPECGSGENWESLESELAATVESQQEVIKGLKEALTVFMDACSVRKEDMQAEKNAIKFAYEHGRAVLKELQCK